MVASVLGAGSARLGQEVAELEAAGVDRMEGKVTEARGLIARSGLQTLIEVDGGISAATAPGAVQAGAQLLVAGSAILAHPEGRPAAVAELRRSLQPDVETLRE